MLKIRIRINGEEINLDNLKFSFKKVTKILRHKLMVSLTRICGTNNTGKIMTYCRGGGHKQKYRAVDFQKGLFNLLGIVLLIEKDPKRSANIGLILYRNGVFSYILLPSGVNIGDTLYSSTSKFIDYSVGNSMPIRYLCTGFPFHNLEYISGDGGQLARAAGTYCTLLGKLTSITKSFTLVKCIIKLTSGEEYILGGNSFCSLGVVSNLLHRNQKGSKAGCNRWKGRRPVVRGVAMNPVDHPHGGGEGKTSGGRCSVSFSGVLSKGKPTRKRFLNKKIIIKRQRLLKIKRKAKL